METNFHFHIVVCFIHIYIGHLQMIYNITLLHLNNNMSIHFSYFFTVAILVLFARGGLGVALVGKGRN